jgi:hypothetical protein
MEALALKRAPNMPEKTNVKIAIITAGVSTAQAMPSTDPL